MNLQRILVALGLAVLMVWSWQHYGLSGLLLTSGFAVMWLLLNIHRTLAVLRRTANMPVGYIGSAVMLNAKLKPQQTLLHVTALTSSLGQRESAADVQPEVYRWTDPGNSSVVATFQDGRLQSWELIRPPVQDEPAEAADASAASANLPHSATSSTATPHQA